MIKEKLQKLLSSSYSPYSKVQVSSIVKVKNNKEYYGVNVENASYGATICAERSALTSAITDGVKFGEIIEINVFSNLKKPLYPCLICLQFITEFCDNKTKIIIHSEQKPIETSIDKLAPYKVTRNSF